MSGGSGDIKDYDYCVHPSSEVYVAPYVHVIDCTPIELESDVVFDGICTDATPCGRCKGECDNDSHCAPGLVCF
jgi:hypothetical protein